MKKKSIAILLVAVLLASLLLSCSPQKETQSDGSFDQETAASNGPLSYEDFVDSGKTIGAQTGDIYATVARDIVNAKEVPEYPSTTSLLEALKMGKVDAVIIDSSYMQTLIDSGAYPSFDYILIPEEVFTNKSAVVTRTEALRDDFNEWLAGIVADGTMAEMEQRWLGVSLPDEADIPRFDLTGKNGTLRVCDTGDYPPFSYFDSKGEYTGMDCELMSRFAEHMGMGMEVTTMAYDAVIPYVLTGKADMTACFVTVSEERGEAVIFSDPIVTTQGVLIVPQTSGNGILTLKQETSANNTFSPSYTDFAGKNIGTKTGGMWDAVMEENLGATVSYYNDLPTGIESVRKGVIDGFVTDYSNAKLYVATEGSGELVAVEVPPDIYSAPMGAISMDQDIIDRFNEFLAEIKADGTFDEMQIRWFDTVPDLESTMPDIPLENINGSLRVAVNSDALPFSYVGANGKMMGYSVELARRFAAGQGMDIEFFEMEFGGMLPFVVSGKADLAIADITITGERKKSVLFTDSIYDDCGGIIALKHAADTKKEAIGFTQWLKTGIERNLITDNRWKMIVDGLGVTMTIAVLAQIFGTAFGAFICWLLMRKNWFVRLIGNLYCGLIHGTPIVVLLMLTYYIIFGSTSISNVLVAVSAFTMITGASVATNFKGSIETVDAVEIEAARSIGFSAFKAFSALTLPQAVRRALPGYTNGFVELVKATAIVGYIAIQDLTRAGDIIRSRTYDAYFPLLFVAVIYLIVTTVCVQIFKLIVKRINSNTSTPRSKGKTALDWKAMRKATGGDLMDAGQTERRDN